MGKEIEERLNRIEEEIRRLKSPPKLPSECENGDSECPYATKYALWWVWQQVEELKKKLEKEGVV